MIAIESSHSAQVPTKSAWQAAVSKYQKACPLKASWQLINTLGSYIVLWILAYYALSFSYWLAAPIVLLMAGMLTRVFIIFHDCGHGSFFPSRRANDICGFFTGILTFTPYHHWRWRHSVHHSNSGNLDHRGVGDVWMMTVKEYRESSFGRRFIYRVARNPLTQFVIGPFFYFVLRQRIPSSDAKRRERESVWWMNLGIVCMVVLMSVTLGFLPYLVIQCVAMALAGSAGAWLFYVQHQFEGVSWERTEEWDWTTAALAGSSFYRLPRVLQWFSGNIGFHHIHHLSSRIPNYNLEKCHYSDPMFQQVKSISLRESLKSLSFHLWDESNKQLIGFKDYTNENPAI